MQEKTKTSGLDANVNDDRHLTSIPVGSKERCSSCRFLQTHLSRFHHSIILMPDATLSVQKKEI
jgi:hypothetical protein